MTKPLAIFAATAFALVSASPTLAHHHGGGGTPPGGATSVPEPTDAVLLLMGAAGVVIGRRLHARVKKND